MTKGARFPFSSVANIYHKQGHPPSLIPVVQLESFSPLYDFFTGHAGFKMSSERLKTGLVAEIDERYEIKIEIGRRIPEDNNSLFASWEEVLDKRSLWQLRRPRNSRHPDAKDFLREKACDVILKCEKGRIFTGTKEELKLEVEKLSQTGKVERDIQDLVVAALAHYSGLDVIIFNAPGTPGPTFNCVSHLDMGGNSRSSDKFVVLGNDGKNFQCYIPRTIKDDQKLRTLFNKWEIDAHKATKPMKRKLPFVPTIASFKIRRPRAAPKVRCSPVRYPN